MAEDYDENENVPMEDVSIHHTSRLESEEDLDAKYVLLV